MSTNSINTMQTLGLPMVTISINEPSAYNADGVMCMDKTIDTARYIYDNNIVVVNRNFIGTQKINELIEQYILKEYRKKLPQIGTMCYNNTHNTTVVRSAKEENE